MRVVAILAAVALACTAFGCAREPAKGEILKVALAHLSQKFESKSPGPRGILLLHTRTTAWTAESLNAFVQRSDPECAIPTELYDAMLQHQSSNELVSNLVGESDLWRLASREIEERIPSLPPEQVDGAPVKTMVSVSLPGVTRDNSAALVVLSFTWSIHSAVARIWLEPSGSGWRVKCSRTDFYV